MQIVISKHGQVTVDGRPRGRVLVDLGGSWSAIDVSGQPCVQGAKTRRRAASALADHAKNLTKGTDE